MEPVIAMADAAPPAPPNSAAGLTATAVRP